MKKCLVLLSAFLLVFGLSGVAGADSITFGGQADGFGGLTSSVAGVTVETFNAGTFPGAGSGVAGWTWAINSGSAAVVTGSVTNQHSAPFGSPPGNGLPDSTPYVAVGPSGSGSVTVTNFGTHNYFGIWWGSADQYNKLSFSNGATFTPGLSGFLTGIPYGSPTDPLANQYVNFVFDTPFSSFTMESTAPAFEADNIAIGDLAVPEPATLILLGSGLLGIGVYARRKFRK